MNTAEINKYWKHLENKYKEPKYISKVKIIDFKFLKKKLIVMTLNLLRASLEICM